MATKTRYGIVFSGGGALGAWEVGAYRAIRLQHGTDPTVVSGASAGALNAVAICAGMSADCLEKTWTELQVDKIYRNNFGFLDFAKVAVQLLPAERIPPDEPDRIAQQQLERRGRHGPVEDFVQAPMRPAHQPIMGSDRGTLPIAPAGERRHAGARAREFGRAREQAIGFAAGMLRDAGSPKIHHSLHARDQR